MELKSIDVTKLAAAKNEELIALATEFKIEHDPAQFNRAAVIAALKDIVSNGLATTKNIKVVFHNVPNTPNTVYVELNGKSYNFPKDTPVLVPAEILALVDEAYEWRTEINENGQRYRRKFMAQTYNLVND